ncbi:MAG TPA: hypothetical protein VF886_01220 [Roseiarcus sp.]|jgi:hypothetical protein
MAARAAAIALCLAALAPPGRALAEDDPSCAQYQEPMAYNACLARHGPKANEVGAHSGAAQPERAVQDRAYGGEAHAPATGFGRWPHAQRVRGRVHMEFQVR